MTASVISPRSRRARGEVPFLILQALAEAAPGERFTPYGIAKKINVSPGSATAAVKRLVEQDLVRCYGLSPLIIGPLGE